ncbi:MAG TPA: hypothetical protein VFN61_06960 [Acidimicrobiales bacterium]|nr:hypothetical protein [Acidimicrobiales bacterium]
MVGNAVNNFKVSAKMDKRGQLGTIEDDFVVGPLTGTTVRAPGAATTGVDSRAATTESSAAS